MIRKKRAGDTWAAGVKTLKRIFITLVCIAGAYLLLATPAFAFVCAGRTVIETILAFDPPGGGPLHNAVIVGSLSKVEQVIEAGTSVDKRDKNGATPLFHAVGLGHNEIAQFLIAHGANVKARDSKQFTPLHLAALGCNQEMVKVLLERGADVSAISEDEFLYTPLHNAINGGSPLSLIKLLVVRGAAINAGGEKNICTPLCLAKKKTGRQDIVNYLRSRGAY